MAEKMVKVKANHTVNHDGTIVNAGSVFKIDEANANFLIKSGAVSLVGDVMTQAESKAIADKAAADKIAADKAAAEEAAKKDAEEKAAEAAAKVAPGAK